MQRRCVPSPLVGEGQGGVRAILEAGLTPPPQPSPTRGEGARRASGPLMAWILVIIVCLFISGAAHAHAVLSNSHPADGAVLREAPREVVLRFNEPVAPVMLRVLDIEAKAVADGSQARIENETLRLALPADLPNATYVVTYRVISLDSHPVSGTIVFSLGDAPAPRQAAHLPAQDRMTVAAGAASRAPFLAALLVAAGR